MRDVAPAALPANIYLDQQVALTSSTDTVTLPSDYPIAGFSTLVATQGVGCPNPGMRIIIEGRAGDILTLAQDMLGGTVYIGTRYLSKYLPTMPQLKDRNGITIGTGQLRVQQFYISFIDTGALTAWVDSKFSGSFQLVDYTGRKANAVENVLGSTPIVDDTLVVPFRFKNDEAELRIESDSHLPFRLIDIEWRGKFTKRGRRV
jgi:hypothetical protein